MWERQGDPPNVIGLAWGGPDGSQLAAARSNHTVQVWNGKTFRPVVDVQLMAPPTGVGWLPGGGLAIGCTNCTVRYIEAATAQLKGTLVVAPDQSHAVAVSTAGQYRTPDEAAADVVYVAQTDQGQETLSPKAFKDRFKWTNNPGAVTLGK
jgi:hypothetical protein